MSRATKQTFDQWLKSVDREVIARTSLSYQDLPDCCYADWYSEGMTPSVAARKAIRMAKGGEE